MNTRTLRKPATVALITTSMLLTLSSGQSAPREWRSNDGRSILATGVGVNLEGVLVSRDGGEPILLRYSMIDKADSEWAIANLGAFINDDARISAKSVQQQTSRFQRETGNYAISIDLFRVSKGTFGGNGTISPIMENVKESGRVVEVTLSSLKGRGITAVEFYSVNGTGTSKELSSPSLGVFEFDGLGSTLRFATGVSETYGGWVVLTRSIRTGEITGAAASMTHLIDFVKNQVPGKITFEAESEDIKTLFLKKLPNSTLPPP